MANETSSDQQWIVRFAPHATPARRTSHLADVRELTADDSNDFHVQVDAEFSLPDVIGYVATCNETTKAQLEALPGVYQVEKQQRFKKLELVTQTGAPWGLARLTNAGRLPAGANYSYKYRTEASGQGVTAYIIDTGIFDTHTDFGGRARKCPRIFAPAGTSAGDTDGHGTHVAGTVGSKTYGVAKNVSIVGVKVFDDQKPDPGARTSDIILALQWVANDVMSTNPPKKAVVNVSLGGGFSDALDAAVASLVRKRIIVVAAAGNEQLPADYSSPGREPLAVTVGASDVQDNRPDFSNWGRLVDVFAPGYNIKSTYINDPDGTGGTNRTAVLHGTSMASPHVAGLVANILSNASNNFTDYREVVQELLTNAEEARIGNLDIPVLKDLNPKFTTTNLIAKNQI